MKGVLGLLSTKRPTMFAYLVTSCVRNHTIFHTHAQRRQRFLEAACVCVCVCVCVRMCVGVSGSVYVCVSVCRYPLVFYQSWCKGLFGLWTSGFKGVDCCWSRWIKNSIWEFSFFGFFFQISITIWESLILAVAFGRGPRAFRPENLVIWPSSSHIFHIY